MAEELTVTIKIDKKKNPMMFDKISKIGDLNKYFEYLINLDKAVNGTDQEYVTEPTEIYTSGSLDSLDVAVHELELFVEDLDRAVPEEYRLVFYGPEEGDMNYPDDSALENIKYTFRKIFELNEILQGRKELN